MTPLNLMPYQVQGADFLANRDRAGLERQFAPGMTWENRNEWELDHKRPPAGFDLSDPRQRAEACHYTNIQPLWRVDNRRKGAKCL